MFQKALLVIGIPLLGLFLVIWFFFSYWPSQSQISNDTGNGSAPLPIAATTTPTVNTENNQITLPGKTGLVTTNNFYKTAVEITDRNDALITSNDDFQILYYPADNSFFITITNKPIESVRKKAETELLNRLGISTEDACRLKVSVGAPGWVDDNLAGQELGLSFCK